MKKIFILLAVLAVIFSGCITVYNPATEKKECYFINTEEEISIGKALAKRISSQKEIISSPKLNKYVRRVGESIARSSDRPSIKYHFYIINESQLNAFSLPGGFIFVNKGLIDKINEDELAFVLGHEIGHVCARHSVKRLQASLGFNILIGIASRNVVRYNYQVKRAVEGIYQLISLGYSRQDEFLADSLGIKYITKSGYNPYAAVGLFKKLKAEEKGSHPFVFLKSHPQVEARIAKAKEAIRKWSYLKPSKSLN